MPPDWGIRDYLLIVQNNTIAGGLTMKMYAEPHCLNDYLNQTFECDCGRTHSAPLKFVSVRKDALEDLPKFMKELGFQSAYLISDSITYKIAGEKCMEILNNANVKAQIIQLTHMGFDEATLGELVINMPADCDLVVAVGTGTINDMTRYFSFKMGRPFFTVATAAPMDGFASSVAAIHVNNLKTTFEAQTPTAIIGDTEILKGAPYSMIAAGLGDLLGKATCLCDWRLAHIITGEHSCENIIHLVEDNVNNVLATSGSAKDRDPQVLGNIMEGLVLAGVAMSLYGNSRPASGCEHHMSHYWETIFAQRGERPVPHGTQVSVGTVLVLKAVEELLKNPVDFQKARAAAAAYDAAAWEQDMHKAYGPAAPGVIAMEQKAQKNEPQARLARIDAMEQNWEAIEALLKNLPSSEYVMDVLRSLSSPCLPHEIRVDKALLKDTFLYCKEVRARYTILQMLWDLDLLDSISDAVIAALPNM